MKKLYHRVKSLFNSIRSKIAFYPTVLSVFGIALSVVMLGVEQMNISSELKELVPAFIVENGDTALAVLSVCIGGLISMMVFSFSMVMLLLSQASSNFSPRLLPGLISDKNHQIILGTYLATILYNIFILFAVEPTDDSYSLPGLSIFLGILLTIVCLCAFIYFIHNISQSIQVNNILDTIFSKSISRMKTIIELENETRKTEPVSFPETTHWSVYTISKSGYFQNVSVRNLLKLCAEKDLKIYLTIPKGMFVLQNSPFIKTSRPVDEATIREIVSNISFQRGELVEDNYILAFKQITEIAVKAMSPGINDPGTAINAIDYLTELFSLRMKKTNSSEYHHNGQLLVKIASVNFDELLFNTMASLRTYCKHDPILIQKLLWMLAYLAGEEAANNSYYKAIAKEKKRLMKDANKTLKIYCGKKMAKKLLES